MSTASSRQDTEGESRLESRRPALVTYEKVMELQLGISSLRETLGVLPRINDTLSSLETRMMRQELTVSATELKEAQARITKLEIQQAVEAGRNRTVLGTVHIIYTVVITLIMILGLYLQYRAQTG